MEDGARPASAAVRFPAFAFAHVSRVVLCSGGDDDGGDDDGGEMMVVMMMMMMMMVVYVGGVGSCDGLSKTHFFLSHCPLSPLPSGLMWIFSTEFLYFSLCHFLVVINTLNLC